MEAVNLHKRQNTIETYGITPTLPYDIEGVLVETKGKDIKVEKSLEDRKILYSIRLKDEIKAPLGTIVEIDKENILWVKAEEKKTQVREPIDTEKIIKDLDLGR